MVLLRKTPWKELSRHEDNGLTANCIYLADALDAAVHANPNLSFRQLAAEMVKKTEDFSSTWRNALEEISEDELKIVKIDVDENPETAQKFGIMSIPTLLFKKDGEVVKQVAGVHTKEQIKAIVAELS